MPRASSRGRTGGFAWIAAVAWLCVCGNASSADRSTQLRLAKGNAEYREFRFASALACYDEALEDDADYAIAHNNRALALFRLGRLTEAVDAIGRAIALDPEKAGFDLNHGKFLAVQGSFEEALEAFDAALTKDGKLAAARYNRAWVLDALGRRDEALDQIDDLIASRKDRDYALAPLLQSVVQARLGDTAAVLARDVFDRGAALPVLLRWVAPLNRYLATGGGDSLPGASRELFREALRLGAFDAYEPAIEKLEEAAALAPDSPLPHWLASQFQLMTGNHREATAALKKAQDAMPALAPGEKSGYPAGRIFDGIPRSKLTQPFSVTNSVGVELVMIVPGRFEMGSQEGGRAEKPVHEVTLVRPYLLGRFEVTQKQYESVMGKNPSRFKHADRPVEMVSWHDAAAFCEGLTRREHEQGWLPPGYVYRLPTEAEWEYAARGGAKGNGFRYAGSDEVEQVAWYWRNGKASTWRVGMKEPNELGLSDMSGNVLEWCCDWVDQGYYADSPEIDPLNTEKADFRAKRGGSFRGSAWGVRPSSRFQGRPPEVADNLGFRLCLVPPRLFTRTWDAD